MNKEDIIISLLRAINKLIDDISGPTETINKLKFLLNRIISVLLK